MKTPLNVLDLSLVGVGAVILMFGLYRMFPLKFDMHLLRITGPLVVMLVISFVILVLANQPGRMLEWLTGTLRITSGFLPVIILLFLVMSIGVIVARIHETWIQEKLLNHRVSGPIIAALLTPTSNALMPIVESAWKTRELQPMCLYYLQASALMSMPLFFMRSMGLSKNSVIAPRMYLSGIIISFIMFPLMRPICWLVDTICLHGRTVWPSFFR